MSWGTARDALGTLCLPPCQQSSCVWTPEGWHLLTGPSGIFGATQEDLQAPSEAGEKSTPSRDWPLGCSSALWGLLAPEFYLLSLSLLPRRQEFDLCTPRPQTTSF